jgi:predicted nucleic acid-binding Zn finger protein
MARRSEWCILKESKQFKHMTTIFVTPKSKKAKNRFFNLMNEESECIIEQNKGDRLFLRSLNGKNFFWVNLTSDSDWIVEL